LARGLVLQNASYQDKRMKYRKRSIGLIGLSALMLTSVIYFFFVNRNSREMTGKQKIMKTIYPLITGVTRLFGKNSDVFVNTDHKVPVQSVYDLPVKLNSGSQLNLKDLSGKKILVVNTASDCGYTRQYEELQELQTKYAGKLQVIGFPANDFSEQEKGSDEEIMRFCKLNYGISFPLSTKTVVIKSENQDPVFKWLSDKSLNGWNDKAPSWNFSKYLINEKGTLTHYFDPSVSPLGHNMIEAVEL
jgi:glutathione peroxidase